MHGVVGLALYSHYSFNPNSDQATRAVGGASWFAHAVTHDTHTLKLSTLVHHGTSSARVAEVRCVFPPLT